MLTEKNFWEGESVSKINCVSCLEIGIRERVPLVNAKVVQVSLQNNILSLLFKALPNHPKQQFFEKVTIPQYHFRLGRGLKSRQAKNVYFMKTHKRDHNLSFKLFYFC